MFPSPCLKFLDITMAFPKSYMPDKGMTGGRDSLPSQTSQSNKQ